MSSEDADILAATLVALEHVPLTQKLRLPFEQWRAFRSLLITIRAMYCDPPAVDRSILVKYRAMIVAAARYERAEVLNDCTSRVLVIVSWLQAHIAPVSSFGHVALPASAYDVHTLACLPRANRIFQSCKNRGRCGPPPAHTCMRRHPSPPLHEGGLSRSVAQQGIRCLARLHLSYGRS